MYSLRSLLILISLMILLVEIIDAIPLLSLFSSDNTTENTCAASLINVKHSGQVKITWQQYFRCQFTHPKGIIAVLLLIGGDIVQKAVAQSTGGKLPTDNLNLRLITPIVFSFGWVSFSFNAVASALGDGTYLSPPDYPGYVITISSGDTRQNQSWVLGG
ncbi:hypothetical protein BJ875DRAFT_481369 [Amylocarpus encephaloides]|uniref:Uncharacterized protein n=1 Tax=Amylocarpus encephaloides TaxID=45428 RepID=A0A9P7YPH4_9HELO|nr:hypothetical protein BJ875DRAFT_481369 [Amylocarpus encephaloides]